MERPKNIFYEVKFREFLKTISALVIAIGIYLTNWKISKYFNQ